MKLGLSTKIIIVIEIVVVVVAVSCGAVALYLQRNTLEALTSVQLQSVSVLKEYNIKRYINLAVAELEFYSERKETRDTFVNFLQHGTKVTYQETHATLNEMLAENTFFLNVFLMDGSGVVVASTDTGEEGKIRSGESFFLNAKKGTAVQSFYYDITTGKPELIIAGPITDERGALLGILATKIKLEDVSSILREKSGLGATGETFLVNAFNLVVTDLLKEPGAALKKTLYEPQINDCLQGNSSFTPVTDYHGDAVFEYWHWLPEIKSCLVTKIDSTEALAPMQRITLSVLGIIGIISLLVGIVAYFLGQTLVYPLRALRDLAVRIKEGDFKVKADTSSHDEIGEIALAFNEMAEHLSKYTGDLEAEVEKRTEEIHKQVTEYEKLNRFMVGREVRMAELKKENEALRSVPPKAP